MKYICLGYIVEKKWETMPQSERNTLMDACFVYDDGLRKNGRLAGGEALQSARNATTLRRRNGKVSITDGPYAETKEQLGEAKGLQPRHTIDVEAPRCEGRPLRDSPDGRLDRNDPRE
jgi:hypothetical protein